MALPQDDEEGRLRAVAIQNSQSILLARQRAEQELVSAKEALELRTEELERANELIRTIAENAASGLLMLDTRGVPTYMNPRPSKRPAARWKRWPRLRSTMFFTRRSSGEAIPRRSVRSATRASR